MAALLDDEYKVGSISECLGSVPNSGKNANDDEELSNLFSNANKNSQVALKAALEESAEREKETALAAAKDKLSKAKKQKLKTVRDPERDTRTIFVGNVPVSTSRKELKKYFKRYGTVESVRLRSAPIETPKMSRRLAVIKKQFHAERHNINAYVVFEKKESVADALDSNGDLIGGCHIRVDAAVKTNKNDTKSTVFVGNLPFGVEEENVRTHFSDCGEVESVRLIRDKQSGIGKGFGYVLFRDPSSVTLALRMNNSELLGRRLRIFRATDSDKQKRKINSKRPGEMATTSRKKPMKSQKKGIPNKNNALKRLKTKQNMTMKLKKDLTKSNKRKSKK